MVKHSNKSSANCKHVISERECRGDCLKKSTFVGVTMNFTKVISKLLRRQNFAVVRKNLDGTTAAFAECCRKLRGLESVNVLPQTYIERF